MSLKNIKSSAPQQSLIIEKLPGYFLITCLIVAFYYMIQILAPFLTVLFTAAVLAITFYPVYRAVLKYLRGWERTASFLTCLFVILVTVVPVTVFMIMLAGEGVTTYELVQQKIESGVFDKYLQWEDGGVIYELKKEAEAVVDLGAIDIKQNVINLAQNLSSFLVSQTGSFLKSISNMLFNFLIMLFALFYFFKDGKKIVEKAGNISPLPSMHESELFVKMGSMVKAIVVGVFLTAVLQGVVGGIGFAIAGISSPVFWGTAIAIFSMVPMVGTAFIWVPAALILLVLGSYGAALFLFLWGVFVIGSIDNLARPFLIGGKAHTYPLLTFFVILGGVWTMGFKGVIVGPLVLMVLMSLLHIYEAEYQKVLKK